MAQKIIKGKNLMLFNDEGKSYAYATSHKLTISAETSDTTPSSKDHSTGAWEELEVTKYSWEITSENLYTQDGYDTMFDAMITGKPINVKFGLKAEADDGKSVAGGDYDNWTPTTTGYYEGEVFITSLEANAENGSNATYSATLTGNGKISRVKA